MTSDFTYVCTVDRIGLSQFNQGQLTSLGNGHAVVFTTATPKVLVIQCVDYYDEEIASIVLTSSSKAWLQEEYHLIFDRPQGGLWRLDCSASDHLAFSMLQDVLTYIIRYENRHHMHNTLAWMDPNGYQITNVIATNVFLDEGNENTTKEKLPVKISKCADKTYKVKLLYKTSDALINGSDWIAQAFVSAGESLAHGIQKGTDLLAERVVPAKTPMKLSDSERLCLDVFSQTTCMMRRAGQNLITKAVSATVSGINARYSDPQLRSCDPMQNATRHFGISAIQATTNIIGGAAMAATAVLTSSRDGIAKTVHRKYGNDAFYVAKKTIGVSDILVYFDAHGISRPVTSDDVTLHRPQDPSRSDASSTTREDQTCHPDHNYEQAAPQFVKV
ncbi:hypothetical protein EC973_007067 [Apophysomyces ossiformis]|uniref:Senescence domain-containing protein n=1 Tax=Apophysomyces ossiformis TaxID=679940 RepID=A0A8H7BZ09_9FUNG|nr:hypothetical protein EC973_007067 [Apophysomyces ossiformis]